MYKSIHFTSSITEIVLYTHSSCTKRIIISHTPTVLPSIPPSLSLSVSLYLPLSLCLCLCLRIPLPLSPSTSHTRRIAIRSCSTDDASELACHPKSSDRRFYHSKVLSVLEDFFLGPMITVSVFHLILAPKHQLATFKNRRCIVRSSIRLFDSVALPQVSLRAALRLEHHGSWSVWVDQA
jgi:hypothetical protein